MIGCAAPGKKISTAKEKKRLTQEYLAKAQQFEDQNDLIAAKKHYELAFAVNPADKTIQEKIQVMDLQLKQLADTTYQDSISFYKKGKYGKATQLQLTALRLWPEHENARKSLTAYQQLNIKRYIGHIIKKGESLSKISKNYFGSFDQAGMIAAVNNIDDASAVRVGMKLKIPELEDHPFIIQEPEKPLEIVKEETVEPDEEFDAMDMYKNLGIEFFKIRQYDDALVEFRKVANTNPEDTETVEYISKSYFFMGIHEAKKRNLLQAIENFKSSLAFNKACNVCREKLIQTQNEYKENHYKSGMKHFNRQNLNAAISEWEHVYAMDPDYKQVSELLEKAKTIQKNIEAIKKSE